mgnify:CR=1 FL=1
MKTLSFLVIWVLLGVYASASWAIPSLQLYFDPLFNPGASYNNVDESWETDLAPITLATFMQGLSTNDTFRVFISLPGRPSGSDPNPVIGLTVTDTDGTGALTVPGAWVFGNPGLPPHGIFDAWYTFFDFKFVSPGNAFTVFNVVDGTGLVAGFRDDFTIDFTGPESNALYHFDLVDVSRGTNGGGKFKEFAPFSHDAQRNPISGSPISGDSGDGNFTPEPSTMVLLCTGLLGLAIISRRKRNRNSKMRK